jgi:hypothetical protein
MKVLHAALATGRRRLQSAAEFLFALLTEI